jgi:hypothetical protein
MTLDLRKPIAALFLFLGSLLAGYGLLAPERHPEVHENFNLNLIWGLVMVVFGAVMLLAARQR